MRQMIRRSRLRRHKTDISSSATIGKDVIAGSFTSIGDGACIGDGVRISTHVEIGSGARIGRNVDLGNHTRIGEGARIGESAVLPYHVRVQPGVEVPPYMIFEGHELVTPDGVIPNRVGGFSMSHDQIKQTPVLISGCFGRFEVPANVFSDEMIEDYFWGRSEELAEYRLEQPAEPDIEALSDPAEEAAPVSP